MPGDVVHIPDKRLSELEAMTCKTNTFLLKGVPEKLRLQLMLHGEARTNLPVQVVVAGKMIPVTTDGEGRIECWIPPDAATARLVISKDAEYTLAPQYTPGGIVTVVPPFTRKLFCRHDP